MQQTDVPDYLKHVEVRNASRYFATIECLKRFLIVKVISYIQVRLHEEHERCLVYLDPTTRKALVATAEKQLLERHTSVILDKVSYYRYPM